MLSIRPIHWRRFEKFLLHIGCEFRGIKGDHRKYRKPNLDRPIIIPMKDNLPIDIITTNLKTLGIRREEYLKILESL